MRKLLRKARPYVFGLAAFALSAIPLVSLAETSDDTPPSITSIEDLNTRLAEIRTLHNTAAMAVAVIENGELVFIDSQGEANKEQGIPASKETLFRIGSISKMFVALSVLKLAEAGELDLNDTLKNLAPEIAFTNKWENTHPLRLAHLLEHTTGWDDMTLKQYAHNDPSPIPLADALQLFPQSRTSRWPPGTRMSYSNTGSGVAAYIVEKISGVPFEEYVQAHFFSPLSMNTSTFFKPKQNSAATTYLGDEPLDFWHVVYRPAGSISAPITEMADFLTMLINRGQHNKQQLLEASSIDRMEISKTTPGYQKGIQSGYGLANYSSGLADKHFDFHGHSGGLPGGYAYLAYNSKHKNGFVMLLTGSAGAFIPSVLALKQYLTRHMTSNSVTAKTHALPAIPKDYIGFYKSVAPRNESIKIVDDFIGIVKFGIEKDHLKMASVLGGALPPVHFYLNNNNVLVATDTGLPTISFVDDPIAGRIIQAGSLFLSPISAIEVWVKIGGLCIFSLLLIASILYGLFWIPLSLYRKTMSSPSAQIRLWPLLSGIFFIAFIATFQMNSTNIFSLGVVSIPSVSIFVLSILYSGLSLWSIKAFLSCRAGVTSRTIYWFSLILIIAHQLITLTLAAYGMIGFRGWA